MFCSKCGKEIPNESIYCPYCRNKIKKKKQKKKFLMVFLILALIVNVGILIVTLINLDNLKFKLLTLNYEESNMYANYKEFKNATNEINEEMQVFIANEASEAEEKRLEEELKQIDGINSIMYVSKEMAYQEMYNKLGDTNYVMTDMDYNIFPASYRITVYDLNKADEIYNNVILLDNVKRVENHYIYREIKNKINLYTSLIVTVISLCMILNCYICVVYIKKQKIGSKGE